MGILQRGDDYIPVCDYCAIELPRTKSLQTAMVAKRDAGWFNERDKNSWRDACDECHAIIKEEREKSVVNNPRKASKGRRLAGWFLARRRRWKISDYFTKKMRWDRYFKK